MAQILMTRLYHWILTNHTLLNHKVVHIMYWGFLPALVPVVWSLDGPDSTDRVVPLNLDQSPPPPESRSSAYNVLRILTSTGSSSVISWWSRFYWWRCTTESCPIKIIGYCCLRPITKARFKVTGLVAFAACNKAVQILYDDKSKQYFLFSKLSVSYLSKKFQTWVLIL